VTIPEYGFTQRTQETRPYAKFGRLSAPGRLRLVGPLVQVQKPKIGIYAMIECAVLDSHNCTSPMECRDWAPKYLCDYYNRLPDPKPEEKELKKKKQLLKRLLTNPKMIQVWPVFEKVVDDFVEALNNAGLPAWNVLKATVDARGISVYQMPHNYSCGHIDRYIIWNHLFQVISSCYIKSGKERSTRSAQVERLQDISKRTKLLLRNIRNTELDVPVLSLLAEDDRLRLQNGDAALADCVPIQPTIQVTLLEQVGDAVLADGVPNTNDMRYSGTS